MSDIRISFFLQKIKFYFFFSIVLFVKQTYSLSTPFYKLFNNIQLSLAILHG